MLTIHSATTIPNNIHAPQAVISNGIMPNSHQMVRLRIRN